MTNWLPDISDTAGPLYIAIADAIEKDIDAGTLSPGTKLPPQRNVAFDIGVTIGTISRGYALACERGLVSGEVGRGTYVLDRSETENFSFPSPPETSEPSIRGEYYAHESPQKNTVFNLGFASAANVGQAEIISRVSSEVASQLPAQIVDYVRYIPEHWLEAGCKWLATQSWKPERNTVVPVSGAHAGIIAILTTVTNPGDKIVFEGLTYSSIARSTALLGRRIITAKFDEYGLIPEELEKLCAQQHPKLLYLMPSVQNPTLAQLSLERRKQIGEIAHRYNMWIIEDAVYTPLMDDDMPSMNEVAPDLSFKVTGLSKSVSAGLRAGWISCPPRYARRVINAHKMMTGGSSYLLNEIASRMVLGGDAEKVRQKVQQENEERLQVVHRLFSELDYGTRKFCPFVWLNLPEPWLSSNFKNAAASQGVVISDEDNFKATRMDQPVHGIRIGLSSPANKADLEKALNRVLSVLDSGFAGYDMQE